MRPRPRQHPESRPRPRQHPESRPRPRQHLRSLGAAATAGALALGIAACGNAKVQVSHTGNTDGVFANRIVVGALASESGPLPADFAPVVSGAQAYLDMINARGGVNGRKIALSYTLDDQSSPSIDASQARALVDQYHVFAVVAVATPSFTGGGYLADHSVPTFGLAVNPQWNTSPTMFGNNGSYISFGQPVIPAVYLAEQTHATRVGVLAYNISQSQQGCVGMIKGFQQYGVKVAFEDLSVPAPASDLHADVNRMKRAGVDEVVSCMDLSGNVLLSQTMQQAGMTGVTQLWNDGYDESALAKYPGAMQGVYFFEPNVPFEISRLQPGRYPGMDEYLAMLRRYEPGTMPSEASLAGWTSADLFVTGLRAIGHDVTRSRLVSAINRLSSYTANGILAPVDWRTAHVSAGSTNCSAFIQEVDSRFVPVFGSAGSAFTCFQQPPPKHGPINALTKLPPGTPPG